MQVLPALSPRAWLALGIALALPGLRFGYDTRERALEQAGLVGLRERVRDRFRLEQEPAIAPALLSTAEPQTFFVRAQGASTVHVELDEAVAPLTAERVGEALFRLEYDPRRDGTPRVGDGTLSIEIVADGSAHEREMRVVTPLAHPRWFCRSPSARRAATTSEETDELIVVGAKPVEIVVGDAPVDCAFVDEDTIVVSHRFGQGLWEVDLSVSPPSVKALPAAAPLGRLCFDAQHSQLLVARGEPAPALLQLDWPSLEVAATTTLGAAAQWLSLVGEDTLVVATQSDASLRMLTRERDQFVQTRELALGRPAVTLASDPMRARVFVTVTDFRPEREPQLGNHFVQDQILVVDAKELRVVQRVLTHRRSERQSKPGDMDQGGSPLGLWPLQDGALAIAFAGTDELWRLHLPRAEPEILHLASDSFFTPHGVVELADGMLWLTSPAAGALAWMAAGERDLGKSKLHLISLTPSDRELMASCPDALARRIGERGFYESTRSGISCQSCHMHADSDAAAYNLGDHRLVPTLSVRGLLGTAPYLRDGSYPRIQDLDEVAQELYRGYLRPQPGRRYTLQAYVESLPRSRSWERRDLPAEQRGYSVFVRVGCARCHRPPAFTNLGQVPLASLFPSVAATLNANAQEMLDVPSLLSIASSAPYLHDGRAQSLDSVLDEHNPDNLHGETRGLSAADKRDLLRFLSSL